MTVRRPRSASSAQLTQTLTYFDGPQVALLRTDRNREMLAVHVERDDMDHGMFACEISKSTIRKYMDQRFDLRYAFTDAEYGVKHYFFDWNAMKDKVVKLRLATEKELADDDNFPDAGFFSRHHTRAYAVPARAPSEAQKYKIDGTWDASDFSRFYGRISDLYAVMTLSSAKLIKSVAEIDLIFVRQTISHYMWRGGGSYVNFYDSVFERIQTFVPLNVGKIRYASPGYIELNGGKEQLAEIQSLMDLFDLNHRLMGEIYKSIDKALKSEDLKRAGGDAKFSSEAKEAMVRGLTNRLAKEMRVDDPQLLFEMCGNSTTIYAKIVLSFFRRGRDLHKFYAEGRVQTSEEAIRSVDSA